MQVSSRRSIRVSVFTCCCELVTRSQNVTSFVARARFPGRRFALVACILHVTVLLCCFGLFFLCSLPIRCARSMSLTSFFFLWESGKLQVCLFLLLCQWKVFRLAFSSVGQSSAERRPWNIDFCRRNSDGASPPNLRRKGGACKRCHSSRLCVKHYSSVTSLPIEKHLSIVKPLVHTIENVQRYILALEAKIPSHLHYVPASSAWSANQ